MFTKDKISVKQQLTGKRIMITGTTGFLGKVLLEKLIRDIPDAGKIILLIRGDKNYHTARERFDREVAASTIFDRLRDENLSYFIQFCKEKIECVTGEVTEKNFGLSPDDFARLASRVDVVIHSAASVKFRDDLQQSLQINVLSLQNVADLVKKAGGIPLVHVSTCYVNGFNKGDCFEANVIPVYKSVKRNSNGYYEVWPLIARLQEKIKIIEENCANPELAAEHLVELGAKESHRFGWNDTYTFTKWIGEQVITEALRGSTLTIVRPAIIESTYQEPVPGWVEGVKVADAIILAYAREKTPFFPARSKGVIDIIPADLVANSLILAAAEALTLPGKHRLYQCATGSSNPITVGQMKQMLQSEANRNHAAYNRLFPKGKPRRDFRIIDRRLFVMAMSGLNIAVTAYDRICKLTGMKNMIHKVTDFVNTTMKLAVTFSFYASPKCIFHNEGLIDLASRVLPEDQKMFPVDARLIEWERYMGPIHLSGLNRYALKDRRAVRTEDRTVVPETVKSTAAVNMTPMKGKLRPEVL
ncbi:MAG TPA: fatty acyl-CoA reductase [Smithella sp.]|nr:fatty acyl-CoA reductase [Smithella sp.]